MPDPEPISDAMIVRLRRILEEPLPPGMRVSTLDLLHIARLRYDPDLGPDALAAWWMSWDRKQKGRPQ